MKNTARKFLSYFLVIIMIASMSGLAFADNQLRREHVFYFTYGGSVTVPGNFEYHYNPTFPYRYDYYNENQEMLIILSEVNYSCDRHRFSIIEDTYDYYVRNNPNVVCERKTEDSFMLSGYINTDIYYIYYKIAHDVLYSLQFYYPMNNRSSCDRIVESVCNSFETSTLSWEPNWNSYPSRADLDMIRANIKYPNYEFMYLDHYISTYVTHKAVYCFKDPDNDIWRKGNYFTVYYGTKVTILAESQGYACVILNDTLQAGWINCDYLNNH